MHRALTTPHKRREFGKSVAGSFPTVIGMFKAAVTRQINRLRETPGASVWQRNYYETIIRSEAMLNTRRQYIVLNPARWQEDENNPANINNR